MHIINLSLSLSLSHQVKDVCHLWELGGGSLFTPLLATPITPRILPRLSLVLVLDLSRPHTLWDDLITLLNALKVKVLAGKEECREFVYVLCRVCIGFTNWCYVVFMFIYLFIYMICDCFFGLFCCIFMSFLCVAFYFFVFKCY